MRRLRTADYPEEARILLGEAVADARQEAGFTSRDAFADVAGVGVRSVDYLEQGVPMVGQRVLHAVGRTLGRTFESWSKDTPKKILEGGPAPSYQRVSGRDSGSFELVRFAINALADIEVHGADVTAYNRELDRWECILGGEVDITTVRKEAHRVAAERLANPQGNSTT